jgi:hypothetical protein
MRPTTGGHDPNRTDTNVGFPGSNQRAQSQDFIFVLAASASSIITTPRALSPSDVRSSVRIKAIAIGHVQQGKSAVTDLGLSPDNSV